MQVRCTINVVRLTEINLIVAAIFGLQFPSGAYVQIYGCVWTNAWLAGEGQTPQDPQPSAQ